MKNVEGAEIVSLEHKHLAQVEKWPSRHAAANTLLKQPAESPARHPDYYGWAIVHDEEVLAIATIKINKERVGYINCIVNPGNKRQGIGTMLMDYVLEHSPAQDLVHLHAVIDPGNTAARQVLKKYDFTMIGNDANGYLEYAKHKHY